MNATEHYDFAILGGGSAGYAAARTAASLGLKTVVIDASEELGGLCILRGCMPSKTLIESANRNLVIQHAAEFGLNAQSAAPDTRLIRDRKRRLIGEFSSYRKEQLEDGRFALLRGHGRFEASSPDEIALSVNLRDGGTRQLTAGTALIATGSVIQPPPLPGLVECGFWTSDTILDAETIPDSFLVIGGGAIALEMAHYLNGIGRKVIVVQRSGHLLSNMDPDVADVVQSAFERRGIKVLCNTRLLRFEKTATGKRLILSQEGAEISLEAEELLIALGRRPVLDSLGLDAASVSLAKNGQVQITPTMQTSNPRIFAAGDVCSPLEVVHLAIQQGETAAKNAAALLLKTPLPAAMDYRCKLFGVFTEPQTAAVGLSETEATAKGIPYIAATYPFNDHGKSMVMGAMEGFVKLLADPVTGTLLGGSVVGPEATELIHEIAVAMHLNATAAQLATAPHYHPTLSEIWTYPAEELADIAASKS
ncbi:dihydrolipoyl dehydrogenase [soil metagenome]